MHLRATNSNNNNGTTSLLGMTEAKRKRIVKQHATEHDESPKTKAKHSMCRVRVRKSWIESNWMNEFERLHRSKSTTDRQFIHRWTVGVDGVSHYVCDELMFRSRPTHTYRIRIICLMRLFSVPVFVLTSVFTVAVLHARNFFIKWPIVRPWMRVCI